MKKAFTLNRRKARKPVFRRGELDRMLEIMLAFDRSVVELSMGLYNLPGHERDKMRRHNRRLHHALRQRLPRLLAPQSNLS